MTTTTNVIAIANVGDDSSIDLASQIGTICPSGECTFSITTELKTYKIVIDDSTYKMTVEDSTSGDIGTHVVDIVATYPNDPTKA